MDTIGEASEIISEGAFGVISGWCQLWILLML